MAAAREALLKVEDEKPLLDLYINADYVRRGADILKKHIPREAGRVFRSKAATDSDGKPATFRAFVGIGGRNRSEWKRGQGEAG